VSKASLDEKLSALPEAQRSKFRALGLSVDFSRQPPPPPESRPRSLAPTPPVPSVVVAGAEEDESTAFLLHGRSSTGSP